MTDLAAVQHLIRQRSPLPHAKTEAILQARFAAIPNRLRFGLEHWPLASSRVLDVGCAYGNTLAFFGPGSLGVDIVEGHVAFCQAIGLDAKQLDVEHDQEQIPDDTFDYLWVCDVLEHLDAPHAALQDLAAKLTATGRLLVYITTLPHSRAARMLLRRRGPSAFDSATHYYQFTRETAGFLIERAGYRVVSVSVPALDRRWAPLGPLMARQAPTLIFEAIPDPERRQRVREADRKNRYGAIH